MTKYAFINANILNGKLDEDGKMPVKSGSVIVEDEKITKVQYGSNDKVVGCTVIDLNGKYLMPGMINAHIHIASAGGPSKYKAKPTNYKKIFDTVTKYPFILRIYQKLNAKNAKNQLLSGVTTIRTVGGILNFDSNIRDKVNAGEYIGPRMLVANQAISVPGGHFAGSLATEASSPEAAIRDLHKIVETKPDLIKIMVSGGVMDAEKEGEPGVLRMSPEIVKAVCTEAHKLGYKVSAHVESTESVKVALQNGVDYIEHGAVPDKEIIDLFKKNNAVDVCTISPVMSAVYGDVNAGLTCDQAIKNGTIVMNGIIECAKRCLAEGIPVGLGTDSGCPYTSHYDTWREVYYFTKYVGVTNDFALYSITLNNAKILGIDDITGSIEEGKSADFIVLNSNPAEDVKALRNIDMVSIKGRLIEQPKVSKSPVAEKFLDGLL